jgi:hypothetical protein
MMYLHIYNKKMMIHPKKFKEMLVKQRVAKTAQTTFMGIR